MAVKMYGYNAGASLHTGTQAKVRRQLNNSETRHGLVAGYEAFSVHGERTSLLINIVRTLSLLDTEDSASYTLLGADLFFHPGNCRADRRSAL